MRVKNAVFGLGLAFLSLHANAGWITLNNDSFADGTDISTAFAGVTLTTVRTGSDVNTPTSTGAVYAVSNIRATTAPNVFGQTSSNATWGNGLFEYLLVEFSSVVTGVSLDFFANDTGGDNNAQLLAFDSAGNQIDIASVAFVADGSPATLEVSGLISSVRAYWDEVERFKSGGLDNLKYSNDPLPVPAPATLALLMLGLMGAAAARVRRER